MNNIRTPVFIESNNICSSEELLCLLCEIIDTVSDEDSTEIAEVA